MRIVFMGTPEFAVASLSALLENGCQIVAVVTSPDKPSGRGLTIHESAVKKFAVEKGLPILQPRKLKDPEFLKNLSAFHADLQAVVAFRMLPEQVWNMPPKGTINLHASLLPQYRGAAPINHAIMNGETFTGVTTFKLQHEIDTGQIIEQTKIPIGENETAGELHDRLMSAGAAILLKTIEKIKSGQEEYISQTTVTPKEPLKTAPKIFRADCEIDWNGEVQKIYNHIRGLSPYPGAWTTLNGKQLKVFQAEIEICANQQTPRIETDQKSFVKVHCRGGDISLKVVQPSGKKKMSIADFLRGYREPIHLE